MNVNRVVRTPAELPRTKGGKSAGFRLCSADLRGLPFLFSGLVRTSVCVPRTSADFRGTSGDTGLLENDDLYYR